MRSHFITLSPSPAKRTTVSQTNSAAAGKQVSPPKINANVVCPSGQLIDKKKKNGATYNREK